VSEERLRPRLILCPRIVAPELGFCLVPCGHAQQVTHPHRLEVCGRLRRSILWKELQHLVVQAESTIRNRKPDGGGGEALAQGIKDVRRLGIVGCPLRLGDDMTMPEEHEAVHRVHLLIGRLDEGKNVRRGDALCLGTAAGESQ
jgi:hypothetical protein